jgi:hypothetical protein
VVPLFAITDGRHGVRRFKKEQKSFMVLASSTFKQSSLYLMKLAKVPLLGHIACVWAVH